MENDEIKETFKQACKDINTSGDYDIVWITTQPRRIYARIYMRFMWR
jgi:hypothetical protein